MRLKIDDNIGKKICFESNCYIAKTQSTIIMWQITKQPISTINDSMDLFLKSNGQNQSMLLSHLYQKTNRANELIFDHLKYAKIKYANR